MKNSITLLFALLCASPFLLSQSSDRWEDLGDRLAEKAERLAERVERQAERSAENWEARAERFGEKTERKFDRNWKVKIDRLPRFVNLELCPETVFLGIEALDISEEKASKLGFENAYGSYVSKVFENSAAGRAGLQPFDYIYGVNDQRTSDNQGLTDIVEDFNPGDEVTLHFVRKGQKQSVVVKLEGYDDFDFDEERDRSFLGVQPGENEDENDMDGVTIEVVENTTAQEMGLQNGDIVVAINSYPVLDFDDLSTGVLSVPPGEEIEVTFKRDGKEMTSKKAIKSYEEAYPDEENDWNFNEDNDGGGWNFQLNEDGLAWANGGEEQEEVQWDDDRGFMGIYAEQLSHEKAKKLGFDNPYGSYVTGVLKNTGAEKAGIQPFDYIFGVDEYRVGENQNLTGILNKYGPGETATVHLYRKGKKTTKDMTFGTHSQAVKESRNSCEDPFFGVMQMGDAHDGVKINPVKVSTAAEMGLQEGDVITAINDYKMIDWSDLTTAVDMLKPGETIKVEYLRGGKSMTASKAIRSYAETKKCDDCDCGKTEVTIRSTQPFAFTYPFKEGKALAPTSKMDMSNAKISMENVSSTDAFSLQSKGFDASSNSLDVERLALSPNPSNGMFKINFSLATQGQTEVKVYNMSGRAIYEYDLGKFSGDFSDEVDISQNGAGNYFLQVTQDGKAFTKKIVLAGK